MKSLRRLMCSIILLPATLICSESVSTHCPKILSCPLPYEQIVDQMKNIKKSELHLHLGGAWPLEFLRTTASGQEFSDLCLMINQLEGVMDYHDAFQIFGLISKIMNTNERVEAGVVALCQELIQDNVVYAEFRTGLKDLGSGLKGYLESVLSGIQKGTSDADLNVGLILSLRRDTSALVAEETIDLAIQYQDKGVVGIDLSGDSTVGKGEGVLASLVRAKVNGLPITLHIGESEEETADQQMYELLTIKPDRIGHGVHLCSTGMDWVKENKTLVELCLTSAMKVGMIAEAHEHPALKLLLEGHPVAICTDDPLIFNTTLSEEFAKVAIVTDQSPQQIQNLLEKSADYYFLSQ